MVMNHTRAQEIIGPIMISRWALPNIPHNLLYTQLKNGIYKLFASHTSGDDPAILSLPLLASKNF